MENICAVYLLEPFLLPSKINITRENVVIVAAEVRNLTSKTEELKAKDVALTAEILKKIVETNNKESKVS